MQIGLDSVRGASEVSIDTREILKKEEMFGLIFHSDTLFSEVDDYVQSLDQGRLEDEGFSGVLGVSIETLEREINAMPELLDEKTKPFFNHDVKRFHRFVVAGIERLKAALGGQDFDIAQLREKWDRTKKNWEVFRFVMEDVAIRSRDGEQNLSDEIIAIDRDQDISRMLDVLDYLTGKFMPSVSRITEVEIDADVEEEKHNLRIETPHALIVNVLNNCITNAVDPSVQAGHLKLRVKIDRGELVIAFYDDGRGMGDALLQSIFEKGVTQGKAMGTGLGLAQAQERIIKGQGVLSVASREKFITGEGIDFGTTHYNPPNMTQEEKRRFELDGIMIPFSTGFEIRSKIIKA